MSYLKYSFLLGNDHFRLRSLFCGGGPGASCEVVPGWTGYGVGGTCPSHLLAMGLWGPEGSGQPAPCPGTCRQPSSPPGACWKLVRFRGATRYTPSFASGCNVWSQIGGKQPKRRKNLPSPLSHQSTPGTAPAHPRIQLREAWLRLFILKTNASLFTCFFRPDPRNLASRAPGDWFPQKTEGPTGYKGTSYEFEGLHAPQFGLPAVRQEVPQKTAVC